MIINPHAVYNAAQRRLWRNRAHVNNAYAAWYNSRITTPASPQWLMWDAEVGVNRGPSSIIDTKPTGGYDE